MDQARRRCYVETSQAVLSTGHETQANQVPTNFNLAQEAVTASLPFEHKLQANHNVPEINLIQEHNTTSIPCGQEPRAPSESSPYWLRLCQALNLIYASGSRTPSESSPTSPRCPSVSYSLGISRACTKIKISTDSNGVPWSSKQNIVEVCCYQILEQS